MAITPPTPRPVVPLPSPPDPLAPWNLLDVAALSTPLPPIPWLCEAIRLAPGAITLVAGYGYSRKTMALQSLALSVASGKPVWGLYKCKRGRVVHLDYEQGRRMTQERYQRLARGLGFELSELEASFLRAAILPSVYLETQAIVDSLLPIVEGAALVIVDSLRAAFPHADENSSEIRSYLDAMSRLSERTGATIIVIHHARKPNAANGGTETHAIRGSSALFDACQSVYVFLGEKNKPTTVHHQKDRIMGSTVDDFGLVSEDIAGPDGPRHGLLVRHLDAAQIDEAESKRTAEHDDRVRARAIEKVVMWFGSVGGRFKGSRSEVKAAVGGKTAAFDAAWAHMLGAGDVVREGTYREPEWRLRAVRSASSVPRNSSVPHRSPDPPPIHPPSPSPLGGGTDRSSSAGGIHPPFDAPSEAATDEPESLSGWLEQQGIGGRDDEG